MDLVPRSALYHDARALLSARFRGEASPQFFHEDLTAHEQSSVRGKPRPYLDVAVALLGLMKAETLVEIGSARYPLPHDLDAFDPACCTDGHSTMYWARTGLSLHTVDIDPAAGRIVAGACGHLPNVHIVTSDGIAFLRSFAQPIDLLYLDAWDVSAGAPYAEQHLLAWRAARDKMKPTSIVLIDDTDIYFGGKGRLCVPAIIRDGYEPLVTGRQTMLLRVADPGAETAPAADPEPEARGGRRARRWRWRGR